MVAKQVPDGPHLEAPSTTALSDVSGNDMMEREKEIKISDELDRDIEKSAGDESPITAAEVGPPENRDPSLVEFDGPDDPGNPKNWSSRSRIIITISMGMMTFCVTFASSIFAVAIEPVSKEFNIGTTVATLGVTLFILGFVIGPVAFGPASEIWGRRPPLFAGYLVFAVFQIPVAVARNVETIMLGRFISGVGSSAPLAVMGGALADM